MPRPKNGLPRPPAHPRGKSGLLAEIGKALYGQHGYVKPLGELLDVNEKTVRRWLDSGSAIPDGAWPQLVDALELRRLRLEMFGNQAKAYVKE